MAQTATPRRNPEPRLSQERHSLVPEVDELSAALLRARSGDESAFAVVYRTVQPNLLRYLRVLLKGDADPTSAAEDVAAEAWLQIVRDLPTFHGDGADFRAWSATIARNRATDHHRRAAARPRAADVGAETLSHLPAQDNVGEEVLARLGTDRAIALLSALPPDQAEAVVLRAVVGLDATTAAEVLGKKSGAVRMAAHRGLTALAAALAAQQDTPAGAAVTETTPDTLKGVR